MRKMRPMWQYFLFAVPVVVVAFGMQYLSKHRGSRNIASISSGDAASSGSALQELQRKLKTKIEKMEANEDSPTENLNVVKTRTYGATASGPGDTSGAKPGECASVEFPGAGPEAPAISKADWDRVMVQFHDAKALLTAWLADHETQFPAKTYQWMRTQVGDARIQRPANPPAVDEAPDLSWRGIGVVAGREDNAPLIRVGGGFAQLASRDPVRARFELARLLAQGWTPCEMRDSASASASTWNGFLGCMQMSPQAAPAKDCAPGTVSETGWAVSSALAVVASPPGCKIPAFDREPASQCLAQLSSKSSEQAQKSGVHL